MVILRSWLEEFIDISAHSDVQVVNALNSIGFEVEGYQKYNIADKVVIGKVVKKDAHPDAQKLSVCEVDIGNEENLQIVCGASNVRQDLLVAVATEGAKLLNGLEIVKSTLRGVDSFGMLCSAKELGLPNINDGLWELDESIDGLKVGVALNSIKQINESVIIIDVTPNRGDCLSILGVARELAAYFNIDIKKLKAHNMDEHEPGIGRVLNVHYSAKSTSSSIFCVAKQNTSSFGDKALVRLRLALCELKAENHLIAISEYVAQATGVLINLYSSSLFNKKDEKIDITITPDDIGIDEVKGVESVARVGISFVASELNNDDSLIVQAFYVDPKTVARIKTPQTRTLFLSKRGSEPELYIGIGYFRLAMKRFFDAVFYFGALEFGNIVEKPSIKMDIAHIEDIIGQKLDKNRVINLLTRLTFKVTTNMEFDNCLVQIPSFRHDIINVYDLAEEVLRLKGLDDIEPKPLPLVNPKADFGALNTWSFKRKLRHKCASAGFYETVHFIFTQKSLQEKLDFECIDSELEIVNPITAELDTLRASLLPNLLTSAKLNVNNSKKTIPFFEYGTVFNAKREESNRLAFLFSGEAEQDSVLNSGKPQSITFAQFLNKVSNAIGNFELNSKTPSGVLWHPHIYGEIEIEGATVGQIGKLHPDIAVMFDLQDTYICEINPELLSSKKPKAKEFSKFQRVQRDVTITWPKDLTFSNARLKIEALKILELKNIYAIDMFDPQKDSKTANLTIRFAFQADDRTLSEDDMGIFMEKINAALQAFISGE